VNGNVLLQGNAVKSVVTYKFDSSEALIFSTQSSIFLTSEFIVTDYNTFVEGKAAMPETVSLVPIFVGLWGCLNLVIETENWRHAE
jgi:hypothetical protein